MEAPNGQKLIKRYKENYNIPAQAEITEAMILEHWQVEKELRHKLLESTPDNRWEVFETCYTELYSKLDWLNRLSHNNANESPARRYTHWVHLIRSPSTKVYEVGSGKGDLISFLANYGFECKATEITRERGSKWVSPHNNLTWGISDGIHLDQFESKNSYDVVISNQVIEHMHPDDLLDHFQAVHNILTNKGMYIFSTPHALTGPSDISKVFRAERPMGMHLKEYTYGELKTLLEEAGFKSTYAPLRLPKKARKLLGNYLKPHNSRFYLAYLCGLEKLIATLPHQPARQKAAKIAKLILFTSNIMMVGKKI